MEQIGTDVCEWSHLISKSFRAKWDILNFLVAEKIGEYKVSSFNKTKYYSLLHREQLLFLFVSNSVKNYCTKLHFCWGLDFLHVWSFWMQFCRWGIWVSACPAVELTWWGRSALCVISPAGAARYTGPPSRPARPGPRGQPYCRTALCCTPPRPSSLSHCNSSPGLRRSWRWRKPFV